MNARKFHQVLTFCGLTQPRHAMPNKLINLKPNSSSSRQTDKKISRERSGRAYQEPTITEWPQ
jgi:hypothetical protein